MAAATANRIGVVKGLGRAISIGYKVMLVVLLAWIFAYNVLNVPYKLGTDGQKVRCLPWSVFLIKSEPPADIERGDLIQFRASNVGHGFEGYPWVKMVGAVPGDRVEIRGERLFINGRLRDQLWLVKALGKKPGDFDTSYTVPPGEYFVMGTTPESFDSRYWGTIKREQIIGSASPLF